jgi:hypothetical protein
LLITLGVQLESFLPSPPLFATGARRTKSIELRKPMVQQFHDVGRYMGEWATMGSLMHVRCEQLNREHRGTTKPDLDPPHLFCIGQKYGPLAVHWRGSPTREKAPAQRVAQQTALDFKVWAIKHPIHNKGSVAFDHDVMEH